MNSKLIGVLFFVLTLGEGTLFAGDFMEIRNNKGTLAWNECGIVYTPSENEKNGIFIAGDPSTSQWSLVMMKSGDKPERPIIIESMNQKPVVHKTENGFNLVYDQLRQDERIWNVSLIFMFVGDRNSFRIFAEIENREKEWQVHKVIGPVLKQMPIDVKQYPLLLPVGLGRKINRSPDDDYVNNDPLLVQWEKRNDREYEYIMPYPGLICSMQYMVFAGKSNGLCISSPDATFGAKNFIVRYDKTQKVWSVLVSHIPCIPPGQSWKSALVELFPYQGDWHVAADHYRAWVDSVELVRKHPDWINHLAGMMLFIMKQQKGRHIMWKYDEIGRDMSDIADRYGFDFLALFGWAHGGHDHLYPEYQPDPLLGGESALKKGIAQAHARGKKVYMYANGQLMDTGNKNFWPSPGKDIGIVTKNGKPIFEKWQKFADQPGFTHAVACAYDPRWGDIMLKLAQKANEYGADGILYDQLGMSSPIFCFSKNHGHTVPAMAHGNDRAALLKRIADEMNKINPNFVVLTEGLSEPILAGVPYFHGCYLSFNGVIPQSIVLSWINGTGGIMPFNEMFRYTYPEIKVTIRNPNPLEYKRNANYAAVFALNHEVEFRYPTDVTCVKEGIMPTVESYQRDAVLNTGSLKYDLSLMKDVSVPKSMEYLKSVITFQRKHESLLIRGKFVDTCGFHASGPVIAKGFETEGLFGVIVWNPDDTPAQFSIERTGAGTPVASEPGQANISDPFMPLDPHTIRLLVWKTK